MVWFDLLVERVDTKRYGYFGILVFSYSTGYCTVPGGTRVRTR
jgi:hypothetical protein